MQEAPTILLWMRCRLSSAVLGALGPREKIISEKGEMYRKNRSLCKQAIWTLQFCLGRAWSYASSCVSSSPWPTLPGWIMDWERMFGSKPRTDWVTCGWQQVTQKGVGCPALVKVTLQTSQLPRRKSERQEWGGPFLRPHSCNPLRMRDPGGVTSEPGVVGVLLPISSGLPARSALAVGRLHRTPPSW